MFKQDRGFLRGLRLPSDAIWVLITLGTCNKRGGGQDVAWFTLGVRDGVESLRRES